MMAAGIERFDRVVERADAARRPQPRRRLECQNRIGDDGARGDARIGQRALDARRLVGHPGHVREFGSRQGRRYRDVHRSLGGTVACSENGVGCRLGAVDRAAAADADQAIDRAVTHLLQQRVHGGRGHVLDDAVEHAGTAAPEPELHPVEQRRRRYRPPRDDQRTVTAVAIHFRRQRAERVGTGNDPFEPREDELGIKSKVKSQRVKGPLEHLLTFTFGF